ncbi:pyrroline-5-carboxylate reductase [Treponema phagedenis]|uniref:pyrroline-5-carboxylate reductase n=1 Tax=Treponema phagedenis TaxID=162 RepID=UPI0001F63E06|nr:pyrroline-5-carboxylate reductase [Treponema phagedenis]EFW38190.1 pyrroline-5-carboxylate reductase [Treponema phagedenis F0421]QSH99392.1 pyrroline-5-carboxylate reductase [Treponema phagedenis]TYT77774.1 pyrroline-5-carboxylate reductase [Treponema phagedenis]
MYKLGILGIGNMGSAILGGILQSKILNADEIIIYNRTYSKIEKYKQQGVHIRKCESDIFKNSENVFVAVTPQVLDSLTDVIKNSMNGEKLIISVVAGKNLLTLKNIFGAKNRYIRVMSNTPATIGEGMSAIVSDQTASETDKAFAKQMLISIGKVVELSEDTLDIFGSFAGTIPAYLYMFAEAIADGAVACGFPREGIYEIISQSILGSAKLQLETKKHPGELKDQVTTPGGMTIAGVAALEEAGLRNALIKAVKAAMAKSKEL